MGIVTFSPPLTFADKLYSVGDMKALIVKGFKSICTTSSLAGFEEWVRGNNALRLLCGLLAGYLTFINQLHFSAWLSAYKSLQLICVRHFIAAKDGFGLLWPFL